MQTESGRSRFRGYRRSSDLVEMAKAPASDWKKVYVDDLANKTTYVTTKAHLDTLTETRVSELQHIRAQAHFRIKRI